MANDALGELAAALPGYEIGGELGRGAFGVVLAGRHRQLGRQVAIKQLPRAFSSHPEVHHRFSSEAKTLASLDHPHIVPIFDYVEQGELCVLVMELLPGGTVRQRQANGLNYQAACAIALATCSALDYAHQRGVLHRDVKPDNLLFTSAGLLKVTDFGIAKVVGDVAVTRAGETPGTPMYMAPEQCLDQALSPATDVYATGVMLYELLSGHHPFEGSGDLVSTMYRQIHEDARPLRMVSRAVPESLAPVVMRAMAKDPAARYRSARAFGGALAEAAAAAWGDTWPAGEAVRIMSVGPIEAATGWPLTTGPVAIGARAEDRGDGDAVGLHATVLRAAPPGAALSPGPPVPSPPLGAWAPAQSRPPPPLGPPAPATNLWAPAPPPVPDGGGPTPTQALPYPAAAGTRLQYPPHASPDAAAAPAPWPQPAPRRRRRLLFPALALVVVAIVAVAGLLTLGRHNSAPSSDGTTVAPAPANPAQEAADLNGLVQESAGARTKIVSTVASIETCSADLATAASALSAAVMTRQQVVTSLAAVPVSGLPNGAAMRAAMTTGLNDSVAADHDYQAWLAGITATGGCQGQTQAPHDGNWQAAQSASNAATNAKQTFANLWNPVATSYGLPKVSSATI